MAFPEIVTDLIDYLGPVDGTVTVHSRIPNPRPAEFVMIRRFGGIAGEPVRDMPRLDVQAWAVTEPRARELLTIVRSRIWALAGSNTLGYMVYKVSEFMGPTDRTDPETGLPFAWFRPELSIRADDVIHVAP